jgi:hypothetical protein
MYYILILDMCMYVGYGFMSRGCGIYYFVGSNINQELGGEKNHVDESC